MKPSYDHPRFDSLSTENIQKCIDTADAFFQDNGIESEHRQQSRQRLEDILQEYQRLNEYASFEMVLKRSWRKITVTLRVRCASHNALKEDEARSGDEKGSGSQPSWEYKRGENRIRTVLMVKTPDMDSLKYVIRYMDDEKGAFRQGVMMRFLNMVMLVLEPWLAAKLIGAISAPDIRGIMTYAILFLAMEVGSSLFTYFGTRFLQRAYNLMREKLRIEATGDVLRIKTEHIDTLGTGVFTERLIRETANVVNGIDEMVLVITEAFRLVSLLIAFGSISTFMLIYELILFVIYLLVVSAQSKKRNEDSRRLYAATEAYSGFIGETMRAVRDVKLLHCEESFLVKVRDVISRCTDRERDIGNRDNKHTLVRTQFVAWTDFFYLLILTLMIVKYQMPAASALILYNYNGKVFASTRAVAGAADAVYRLLLSSERVYQIMESSDFSKEAFGERALTPVRGEIELKDVCFSYKHKDHAPVPVLNHMDLRISAGQSVALIGRSGCGKSTLLSLISRLYEPDGGRIALDGVDMGELDQHTIRSHIGTVTQTPYLFSMTLRDNFRLVKSDATDEEIVEVCKTACVHDDIMNLPEGYDTMIGEGGSMLSGGQRQRIALARALLKDYPIIMLDEATSALDNETQATIRYAIENMHGRRTVIMIAHRLSTVINCERLFYIQNGRVLASGTHAELLKNCEEYRKLYSEEAGI